MRVSLAIVLLSAYGLTQGTPGLTVEDRLQGVTRLFTIRARDVSVRDVLVEIGARAGLRHRFEEGVSEAMEGQRVPITVDRMPMEEVVHHLAGALGLDGVVEGGFLVVRRAPTEGTPEAQEWSRREALRAWPRASFASGGSGADVLHAMGILHIGGREWGDAASHLDRFVTTAQHDERAPRALLLAAWAALQEGSRPMARSLLERLMKDYSDTPELIESHLLSARMRISDGEWEVAHLLLRRVMNNADDKRLRVLARLMMAELWFRRGDPDQAFADLRWFDEDMERSFPDLAAWVPLYEALCLVSSGASEMAVPRLLLCELSEDTVLRTRSALALARVCRDLDRPFAALQNVSVALRSEPPAQLRIQAHLMEARIYMDLGLASRALAAFDAVVALGEGTLRPDLRREVLQGLADLFMKQRDFDHAIAVLEILREDSATQGWAVQSLARCHLERGDPKEALAMIALLTGPEGDSEEVARLRGTAFMAMGDYAKAALAFSAPRASSPSKGSDQEGSR
jgi:predicted negative regulator of RcsB-dependent stress response